MPPPCLEGHPLERDCFNCSQHCKTRSPEEFPSAGPDPAWKPRWQVGMLPYYEHDRLGPQDHAWNILSVIGQSWGHTANSLRRIFASTWVVLVRRRKRTWGAPEATGAVSPLWWTLAAEPTEQALLISVFVAIGQALSISVSEATVASFATLAVGVGPRQQVIPKSQLPESRTLQWSRKPRALPCLRCLQNLKKKDVTTRLLWNSWRIIPTFAKTRLGQQILWGSFPLNSSPSKIFAQGATIRTPKTMLRYYNAEMDNRTVLTGGTAGVYFELSILQVRWWMEEGWLTSSNSN